MTQAKPMAVNRVDWFRVLSDLRSAGMALTLIATVVRCSKGTLLGLRNAEAEPKHDVGERIVLLWMRQTSLPREKLPMQSAAYSCERANVRRWDGGTQHCPTCGREHGPVGDKSKKGDKGIQAMALFGRDFAPR